MLFSAKSSTRNLGAGFANILSMESLKFGSRNAASFLASAPSGGNSPRPDELFHLSRENVPNTLNAQDLSARRLASALSTLVHECFASGLRRQSLQRELPLATSTAAPMHPTVCNKFRRPLPREPHACGYALCALVASLLRLLALLKLLFPTQDASLVGLGFRLRNHTLALIQNRQAGVREHVVRI